LLPVCSPPAQVTAPVDVSSQVTIPQGSNSASFTLVAQENCCCVTGWGHETARGRLDATFHWKVSFDPFFQLADPNPDLVNDDGSLMMPSSQPETANLVTGGRPVKGAAADNLTVILERVKVTSAGKVTFSIAGWNGPQDGGVSVDGKSRSESVQVQTTQVDQDFYAFAYYLVPEDFNPPDNSQAGAGQRQIMLQADFAPDEPSAMAKSSTLPFTLYRAPVVLIHGIWSDASTWENFGLLFDSNFSVSLADYSDTSGSNFATNTSLGVVQEGIEQALSEARKTNIAATQVDVVTHSMGGNLSRIYVGTPALYNRGSNFFRGDVHKLITLNGPHNGTPFADAVVQVRPRFNLSALLVRIIRRARGGSIDDLAVDDLKICSPAILAIPPTPAAPNLVAAHSLAGTGLGPQVIAVDCLVEKALGKVSGVAACAALKALGQPDTAIFSGEENDGIVNLSSEQGGLTISDPFTDSQSNHLGVTSSSEYSDAVISLLNVPPSSGAFGQFPAPSCASGQAAVHALTAALPLEIDGGLSLSSDALFVAPGDQVPVTITAQNGFTPTELLLVAPGVVQDLGSSSTGLFTVPLEAAGNLDVVAVGFDANGVDSVSEPVTLTVLQQATLQSVRLSQKPVFFLKPGETRHIELLGFYDDGVVRDLTDPSTGTAFNSMDPSILTISPSGLATAVGPGTTAILAANQSVADANEAIVLAPANPVANAGPGETVACTSPAGAQVSLNGSGSSDPAGLPLSFLWTGPFGQASAEDVSVDLPIGSNTVTLTVTDSQGGSASASAVIVVSALTPPAIGQVSAQPSSLWPPNHKLVPVTVSVNAVDACDATPHCTITSVTANESIDGDFVITAPLSVDLRATRLGSGSGRIYTLGVTCVDTFGISALSSVEVTVPHDQGPAGACGRCGAEEVRLDSFLRHLVPRVGPALLHRAISLTR
jgi:pimeloyl-ACP methyl ester carboxylesterase